MLRKKLSIQINKLAYDSVVHLTLQVKRNSNAILSLFPKNIVEKNEMLQRLIGEGCRTGAHEKSLISAYSSITTTEDTFLVHVLVSLLQKNS